MNFPENGVFGKLPARPLRLGNLPKRDFAGMWPCSGFYGNLPRAYSDLNRSMSDSADLTSNDADWPAYQLC